MAAALDISERSVFRAKRRYAEEGLDEVLGTATVSHRKLDDRGEAHLIALACSPAPEGHWTLRLLAKAVELGLAPARDGAAAAKTRSSRGGNTMVHPEGEQ